MRANEFLSESSGGIIRRGQEVAQGKEVTFAKGESTITLVSTVTIPEVEMRYENQEELEQALKDTLAANGNPVVLYYSKVAPKTGAALITLWKDDSNKSVAFVKFFNVKKSGAFPVTWTNADFGRETGYQQADNKIAERAQFKLKPNELFKTDVDLPIASLADSIKQRTDLPEGVPEQIQQLLANVTNGANQPVPGAAQYASTYEIDLGESAAPIALVTGNFVGGDYRAAEEALLKPLGMSWNTIESVLFPGAGSNLLYDSYLRLNENTSLKVSSKDKKGGAAASVTGLLKEISDNPDRFTEVTNNKKYQQILQIVKTVAAHSAANGPIVLAKEFGIITDADAQVIVAKWNKGEKFNPGTKWSPGLSAVLKRKGAKFQDPAYDLGFHLLAGVAELVADKLNAIAGISDFFKAILERSTMVQVKSAVRKTGDGANFSAFTVVYPPSFNGVIKVVAGNNYMSTRKPIGKISFKIP